MCQFLENGSCRLAALLAEHELSIKLPCLVDSATCTACAAAGPANPDKPSVPCLGIVTRACPPEHQAAWSKFVTFVVVGKVRGLGDRIAKLTRATGIDKAVKAVSKAVGKDCGCSGRQKKLNAMFPAK